MESIKNPLLSVHLYLQPFLSLTYFVLILLYIIDSISNSLIFWGPVVC